MCFLPTHFICAIDDLSRSMYLLSSEADYDSIIKRFQVFNSTLLRISEGSSYFVSCMFFMCSFTIVYCTWVILFTSTSLDDHFTIQVLISGWIFLVGTSVSMAWVTSKCR